MSEVSRGYFLTNMSEARMTVSGLKSGRYTTPNVQRKFNCSCHRQIYIHKQIRAVLHTLQKLQIPDNINVFWDLNECFFNDHVHTDLAIAVA